MFKFLSRAGLALSLILGGSISADAQFTPPPSPGGGSGTVTSVGIAPPSIFTAGAPVTTNGSVSFTVNSQTGNQVWAAPAGSSGVPLFRSLVAGDLPTALSGMSLTNTIHIGTTTFNGSTSGNTQLNATPVASGVLTLPAATDTLVGKNTTDTLTNKSLTSPAVTGTMADVGRATFGTQGWLEPIIGSTESLNPQVISLSNNGFYSGIFAVKSSSNGNCPGCMGANAIGVFNINDSLYPQSGDGIYCESRGYTNAGPVNCLENDVVNFGGDFSLGSMGIVRFKTFNSTQVAEQTSIGESLGCGRAELQASLHNCSAALVIAAAGSNSTFDKGIIFSCSAITGATCGAGTAVAIEMGYGQLVQWSNPQLDLSTGTRCTWNCPSGFNIYSQVATSTVGYNLAVIDAGLYFQTKAGQTMLSLSPTYAVYTTPVAATGYSVVVSGTTTPGTNCGPAVPGSSFTVINGIVTHC